MSEQTYTITVSGTQLGLLCEAAELLSRIHLGQLEHVEEKLHGIGTKEGMELRAALTKLNPLVTGLEYPHASRALNDRMKLRHDQAWGLYWGLRYPIYLERCAELGEEPGSWTVMSRPPEPQGGQPVPTVTRVDAELPGTERIQELKCTGCSKEASGTGPQLAADGWVLYGGKPPRVLCHACYAPIEKKNARRES